MMKKRKIFDLEGNAKMISPCIACAIKKGEIDAPGGSMAESKYFVAQQDLEIPIPGFVILVSKRHLQSVDEFTENERQDFMNLLCNMRSAMRQALGVKVIYLVQEEDTSSHFHIWLFPRYQWMRKKFGLKIESLRPIMEYASEKMKTPGNLKKIDAATQKLKRYFSRLK